MALSWQFFRNYLLSRRSGALVRIIAWNCMIGIAIGVAALVIVLSVMNGFNLTIRDRMLRVEPHLVLELKSVPKEDLVSSLHNQVAELSRQGVERVDRFESQDVILRTTDGNFGGAVAKGLEPSALGAFLRRSWVNVNSFREMPQDLELAGDEIALGIDLARSLNVIEGDEILIVPPETLLLPEGEMPKFQKFKVKALLSTQLPDVDGKLLFYNLDLFPNRVRSVGRVMGAEVRLTDPYEAEAIKKKLGQSEERKIQTWGDRDMSLFYALMLESLAMTLFLSLAVFVTSFSLVIVMVLLLNQKRQDIGMLQALGLSVRQAKFIFLRVGILLSAIGVGGGILMGSLVALVLQYYPLQILPDIYTDSTLPAQLSFRIFFGVLLGTSVLAGLGSWLPIWRGVSLQPAESLRRR